MLFDFNLFIFLVFSENLIRGSEYAKNGHFRPCILCNICILHSLAFIFCGFIKIKLRLWNKDLDL